MKKMIFVITFAMIATAVFAQLNNTVGYIPPTVEDTPQFQRYKAKLEADGYTYSHYEVGAGLVVWAERGNSGLGLGNKTQGMTHMPGGDPSKAYTVTWDQYFKAFSDMHRFCFEDKNVQKIKDVIDQIVLETDYDYSRIQRLPAGYQWVHHPGAKYKGVCDDYANLVIQRVSGLPGVVKVTKVSSSVGNHAWNEIWLKGGRVLYCDATWYDTNGYYVDSKTGNYIVDHEPHHDPTMLTFDKELFSLGRTHYGWGDATSSNTQYEIPAERETRSSNSTYASSSSSHDSSIFLFGYNYSGSLPVTNTLPFGISIGFNYVYVSVNFGVGGKAGDGNTSYSLFNLEGQWSVIEWTAGISIPLSDFLLIPIGLGANHSGPDENREHKFVMEIGLMPVMLDFFYISATYRLIGFKKNGFSLGAGIIF